MSTKKEHEFQSGKQRGRLDFWIGSRPGLNLVHRSFPTAANDDKWVLDFVVSK